MSHNIIPHDHSSSTWDLIGGKQTFVKAVMLLALVLIHQSFAWKVMFTVGVKNTDLKAVPTELEVTILT